MGGREGLESVNKRLEGKKSKVVDKKLVAKEPLGPQAFYRSYLYICGIF